MGIGVATSMSLAGAVEADDTNPTTRKTDLPHGNPLRVQPVLIYETPQPKERTRWRNYGEVFSDDPAREELGAIEWRNYSETV